MTKEIRYQHQKTQQLPYQKIPKMQLSFYKHWFECDCFVKNQVKVKKES
jgi:hypothetical protein